MRHLRRLVVLGLLVCGFTTLQAMSKPPEKGNMDIDALRDMGPKGLAILMEKHRALIDTVSGGQAPAPAEWEHISRTIDAVAMQKDAHLSGLYWHTDIEKARSAAQASGRPILSLRLLGTLDSELSCANSRFFRTALYANQAVASYLRDHYVLHWQSVRAVPVITIDFGDGREIQSTITGNSIHYILDPQGRLIDGLPGMYGPAAFLSHLKEARAIVDELPATDAFQAALASWHTKRMEAIDATWTEDMRRLGRSETPQTASDNTWRRLAALHLADARLDESSRRMIQSKHSHLALLAMDNARSKAVVESPLLRLVRTFERSIAEDTVRNEHTMHRQIHAWLAEGQPDVDAFNHRVYAQLFLTPADDPWLGLLPRDGYNALPNNGVVSSRD